METMGVATTVRRSTLLRHLRLWRQFIINAFVREAEYRVNLAFSLLEGLVHLALVVATFLLIYRFSDEVAGWTRDETLMLVGVYRIVDGLIAMQITPNIMALSGYIRQGDLDFYLLRPVSSQFLVSLHRLRLEQGIDVLIGLVLTVYAGNLAGVAWTVPNVVLALLFGLCGLIVLYAVWFCTAICAFWLVQVPTIDQLFFSIFETARYPVAYFNSTIRAFLTFVVPIAFATTFPTEALRGIANPRLLIIGVVLAAAALTLSHHFWHYALRHYSSASS